MCMNMCMYIVAITHSEFAPDFDVRGVCPQVVVEDGVDVAGDGCATLAEDAGDAFKLLPDVVLDIDRVTVHQLCRRDRRAHV